MVNFLNRWTAAACLAVAGLGASMVMAQTPAGQGVVPSTSTTTAPAVVVPPPPPPLAKFKTPLPPQWPVDQTIPGPFGVQLKDGNMSTDDVERVHQLGLKWVRRGFTWRAVEKEKGVYDFTKYERLVADCRDRGMSVIATLGLGNPLYKDAKGKEVHVKDEPAHSAYVNYCVAAVKKFKGQPVIFELWNEPNVKFWGNYDKSNGPVYAADYTKLVKDATAAMKAANPECIVLGGSVSNVWTMSYEWIDYVTKDGMIDSGIDSLSLHPYGVKNPEDYLVAYDTVRKLISPSAKGKEIPFTNSERGFPLGKGVEGFAGGEETKQSEFQAWHLVRQYMIDQLCGVKITSWYEWSGNEGFSLVKGDLKAPAYDACKVMLTQLDGYKLDKRLETAVPTDFVLQFTNAKTGGVKLVAWCRPPIGEPRDPKAKIKLPPITPDMAPVHEIEIPVTGSAATMKTADIYGKAGSADVKDGKVAVTISGSPVYVTVK
ncbi:hypothetical protein BH10PLA1_BH10PLA1_13680 [soil metagenome]